MQPRDKAHQAAGEMRPLTTSRWLEITAKHHYQGLGGEQPGCTGLSLRGDQGCQGAATAGGWQLRSDPSSENLRLPPTRKIKPRQQSSCNRGQLRSATLSHQLPALVTASLQRVSKLAGLGSTGSWSSCWGDAAEISLSAFLCPPGIGCCRCSCSQAEEW